jgi:hypothetical protein
MSWCEIKTQTTLIDRSRIDLDWCYILSMLWEGLASHDNGSNGKVSR